MSRVGGAAQTKGMKKVAGTLRLDLAQYREKAAFAQFGSDLDKATQMQITRGERLREVLKQNQFQPLPVEEQVTAIFMATEGYLDDLSLDKVKKFEGECLEYLRLNAKKHLEAIAKTGDLDDATAAGLKTAIEAFMKTFAA